MAPCTRHGSAAPFPTLSLTETAFGFRLGTAVRPSRRVKRYARSRTKATLHDDHNKLVPYVDQLSYHPSVQFRVTRHLPSTRTCYRCNEAKPIGDFYRGLSGKQ